ILAHHTEENGQWTTPLLIAARNGHEKVVLVLLSNFNADVEATGTVKFDGYAIKGATPLWCAAGAGHFKIVKLLVEHGANVNHTTVTNSTPLRAACYDGRLDIVKYLVEQKADLTIANKYKNTCLMISCYKGHKEVVRYLLESGAPTDSQAHCGAMAVHFAAECGHLEIVKLLVEFNASMLLNNNGLSPLIVAAECMQVGVVDYLISDPNCTRKNKIDAYELLGASYANDKEHYNIDNAYYYLRKGMAERFVDPDNIINKETLPPVPAYEFHSECRSLQELDAIRNNPNALHMEGLTVRERILGSENHEVTHPIIFRGAVFADSARFDRCIALWLHAMTLRINVRRSISKDLLRFAQVFAQMVHVGNHPDFVSVLDVFHLGTRELEYDMERYQAAKDEQENTLETYMENIHTLMYLLVILTQLKPKDKQYFDLCRATYRFIQQKPRLNNGYTPLHMANANWTIVDDFHVNEVVAFPNGCVSQLLVDCGAEVNVQDKLGETPMHLIVQYRNPIADFENLHTCIMSLIRGGAHIDICNIRGKTALDVATTGVAEVIIRTNSSISLKCLAARVVRQCGIQYKGFIPQALEDFVQLHM
ncbi:hypothetical protein DPMN_103403, partial [Dreissena polymorpha]